MAIKHNVKVQPLQEELIKSNSNVDLRLLELRPEDFLASAKMLRECAELYRLVYGADEKMRDGQIIWGDGARDKGNKKHKIPLAEYYRRMLDDELTAPSGDIYELSFSDEYMLHKFQHELEETSQQKPYIGFLAEYSSPQDVEIVGLSWGGITHIDLVRESLHKELVEEVAAITEAQLDEITALVTSLTGPEMLYIRELILRPDYRKAGYYAAYLIRFVLEQERHKGGGHNLFFWTAYNSLMTELALAGGMTKIYDVGGYSFFFGSNEVILEVLEGFRNSKDPGIYLKQRMLKFLRSRVIPKAAPIVEKLAKEAS